MQKKLLILIFFLIFLLLFPLPKEKNGKKAKKEKNSMVEKRAMFISYIELSKLNGKDEITMKNMIDDMLDNSKDFGFNMIILQVRSFSDAIYDSNIFPSSRMVVEKEGDPLPFDLLEYFIEQSHKRGLELHAWINPYRIRNGVDKENISNQNPAFFYLGTSNVEESEKGIFYNPAKALVEELILSGIQEILDNYDVDGIHFDDYFYPTETIDFDDFEIARKENLNLSLQDFRLNITSNLIKKTYQLVKKKDSKLLFGISPEGNIENNYTSNYIDTKRFGREEGFVDYLMPQIYFGFLNGVKPFIETANQWNDIITAKNVKLIPALAFYKVGTVDTYAKEGIHEWIEYNNIIAREVTTSRTLSNYYGFSIFRYGSLFQEEPTIPVLAEKENLKNVLEMDLS